MRLAVLMLFALSSQLCSSASRASDDDRAVELPEIISSLKDWRATAATLRVVWRSWNRNDFITYHKDLDPSESGKTYYGEEEFAWADWGAIRWSAKIIEASKTTLITSRGFDGKGAWEARTKHHGDQDVVDLLQFVRPDSERPLSTMVAFIGVYGLWNARCGLWLDERLERHDSRIVEPNTILDGVPCVLVRIFHEEKQIHRKLEDIIWLDPALHYLPRKHTMAIELPEKGWVLTHTWECLEFKQSDRAPLWPIRGRFQTMQKPATEWEVTEIRSNEPLDSVFFGAPKATSGVTKIIDYVNVGAASKPAAQKGMPGSANASTPAPESADPVKATAPRQRWILLAVIAAACAACGLAMHLWRKRKEGVVNRGNR